MSVRWPSRYLLTVCNGLCLFRYECSAWLWMFYGLVKFYWVKPPNQSCHNSMQFLVDDQWDQISFYFYRNQWTGGRGGGLLQQDLCSYLNVADPRMRSRKEKPVWSSWHQTYGSLVHGQTFKMFIQVFCVTHAHSTDTANEKSEWCWMIIHHLP